MVQCRVRQCMWGRNWPWDWWFWNHDVSVSHPGRKEQLNNLWLGWEESLMLTCPPCRDSVVKMFSGWELGVNNASSGVHHTLHGFSFRHRGAAIPCWDGVGQDALSGPVRAITGKWIFLRKTLKMWEKLSGLMRVKQNCVALKQFGYLQYQVRDQTTCWRWSFTYSMCWIVTWHVMTLCIYFATCILSD